MLKVMGAVLLICSGGWFGLGRARELSRRIRALEVWQDALALLDSELRFRLPDLPELAQHLSRSCPPPAGETFSLLGKAMKEQGESPFEELWSAALSQCAGGLKREDMECLYALGPVLGRYGRQEECQALESVCRRLERSCVQLRGELEREGRTYGTLGLALGAFTAILLL